MKWRVALGDKLRDVSCPSTCEGYDKHIKGYWDPPAPLTTCAKSRHLAGAGYKHLSSRKRMSQLDTLASLKALRCIWQHRSTPTSFGLPCGALLGVLVWERHLFTVNHSVFAVITAHAQCTHKSLPYSGQRREVKESTSVPAPPGAH